METDRTMNPLTIVMAASEAVPFAKTGGLADVAGTLPGALAARGHSVRLVIPYYGTIRTPPFPVSDTGISFSVPISNRTETARVFESRLPGGVTVNLIAKDGYFGRPELYGTAAGDYPDNAERFCFFSRAVLSLIRRLGLAPDILHAHDWQTGLIAPLLRLGPRGPDPAPRPGMVFTIHNIAYQGLFWHYDMHLTGLPWSAFTPEGLEFYGKISLLKAGIVYADAVTTVSPRYSREIQTAELGYGLEGVLRGRRSDLYGILNGADYAHWNPETDTLIAARYGRTSIEGKERCKADLIAAFGLTIDVGTPLIGVVGRMAAQKGYDLIAAAARGLLEKGAALVVLGKGEERYQRLLLRLGRAEGGRAGVKIGFDNALAHKIEAGADYFLMPSRYEPCGLNQIYSLRYGTVPIVRATGGLDDTVAAYDQATGEGTGFKFEDYSAAALRRAAGEALAVYRKAPHWDRIRMNAMACDFSWDRSAAEYERVYRRAAEKTATREGDRA